MDCARTIGSGIIERPLKLPIAEGDPTSTELLIVIINCACLTIETGAGDATR
jgi:hypothetical protein